MKFVKPSATPLPSEGSGGVPSWKMEWIKNKVVNVLLECGHVEDIHANGITLINTFKGASIDCIPCGKFVKVKRAYKRKTATPSSDQPLF